MEAPKVGSGKLAVYEATCDIWPLPIGSMVVPFSGLDLESYKESPPKRNDYEN